MNDPVGTLMTQSISVAREYGKLHQQLSRLIDRRQRTDRNDPLREDLERQIQAVSAEMRAVCGGL
jgi:phage regulator Rha-like protein